MGSSPDISFFVCNVEGCIEWTYFILLFFLSSLCFLLLSLNEAHLFHRFFYLNKTIPEQCCISFATETWFLNTFYVEIGILWHNKFFNTKMLIRLCQSCFHTFSYYLHQLGSIKCQMYKLFFIIVITWIHISSKYKLQVIYDLYIYISFSICNSLKCLWARLTWHFIFCLVRENMRKVFGVKLRSRSIYFYTWWLLTRHNPHPKRNIFFLKTIKLRQRI